MLQLAQDGKISREELYEHVFQPRGTAFDLEEIRNREAKPERELDDIIIELLMQNETTEPEEELTEKTKELIKEATPLCQGNKSISEKLLQDERKEEQLQRALHGDAIEDGNGTNKVSHNGYTKNIHTIHL